MRHVNSFFFGMIHENLMHLPRTAGGFYIAMYECVYERGIFFLFFLAISVTFAVEYDFTREFSFCFLFLDFICSDVVRGLGWG